MPANGLFASLPVWGIFLVTLLLVFVSVEGGFQYARYKQRRSGQEKEEANIEAMVGATLGLLAFLLAFTFGMAADRFDRRRQALLAESNAIGTCYLRAGLLAEPHRTEVRKILRKYVDERLQWAGVDSVKAEHSSAELHRRLWEQVVAVGEKNPTSEVVGLFISSVNEVIDLHATRVMVRQRSQIPPAFWTVLYAVAVLAMAAMGYHSGMTAKTRSPAMLAVAIAFSAVIMLIADVNRPGEGWIDVSQQTMLDLRASMNSP